MLHKILIWLDQHLLGFNKVKNGFKEGEQHKKVFRPWGHYLSIEEKNNWQIKKIEVEGVSGGNLVKVVLSGDYELKTIEINEQAKKESQEIINDLIIAAYNNAKENLKKKSAEELSKVTGGLNLPTDFKLPF